MQTPPFDIRKGNPMEDSRKRCKFAVTKPQYYIIMHKGNNNSGTPVFSKVIKLLDRAQIESTAQKMGANRYTKRLDAYQHLVIMLYATFAGLGSLREIVLGFLSAASRMNHLGLNYMVRRSTLSDANNRRSPQFFAQVYNDLYERYRGILSDSRPVKGLKRPLFIFDSTTIGLFTEVFRGTGRKPLNGRNKGGVKAHTIIRADEDVPVFVSIGDAATADHVLLSKVQLPEGSCVAFDMGYVDYEQYQRFTDDGIFYVTREKKRCKYKVLETRKVEENNKDGIISDEIVELSWYKRVERPMTAEELSHRRGRRPKNGMVMVKETRKGKHKCRRITKYMDNPDEGTITFLTNDMETSAAVICEIYRRRWQIETLFKRLKQNFPLKYFLGDSRNAIEIQIWVSLIAWLLMRVIQESTKRHWSVSNLMTAVRILLNSYMSLYDFLDCPERQWLELIKNRPKDTSPTLFPDIGGPNFESSRTLACLAASTDTN